MSVQDIREIISYFVYLALAILMIRYCLKKGD